MIARYRPCPRCHVEDCMCEWLEPGEPVAHDPTRATAREVARVLLGPDANETEVQSLGAHLHGGGSWREWVRARKGRNAA